MKVDWRFGVGVLGIAFALGFVKPLISPLLHTVLTVGAYGGIWLIYRQKNKERNQQAYEFWARIFYFVATLYFLLLVRSALPSYQSQIDFVYIAYFLLGMLYCFSSTVRMYLFIWQNRLFGKKD